MFESIFELFEKQLRTYRLFSDKDIAIIRSLAVSKQIKKREYLLRQGGICKFHTFVCSGCLRSYRIDDQGIEHIFNLSPANHWVCDRVSLSTGEPSDEFIDALEDSSVVQFSAASFDLLLEQIPGFRVLNTKIITDDCGLTRDRVYMMLSYQAEERYREFIRNFPQLHKRLPVYMIASYLGISRETLTRIRSNMVGLSKPCKVNAE
ncbi:Crp/Fnr family transcriptional regulator [Arachidicoccus terrestris]|uniref:Crp/Fnr family transcriptional regulator n=1 Tax=Arachidicoccus terrestris TaxID=2875539 RepID=UPI001CC6BF93|nr:Crp/Fnr family transcriptional regulator [Arachidicoccus terrestris]UAY56001.1 Crp/Fnr family transcriptional regulator [Arachidicoccus terrestris]